MLHLGFGVSRQAGFFKIDVVVEFERRIDRVPDPDRAADGCERPCCSGEESFVEVLDGTFGVGEVCDFLDEGADLDPGLGDEFRIDVVAGRGVVRGLARGF